MTEKISETVKDVESLIQTVREKIKQLEKFKGKLPNDIWVRLLKLLEDD